MDTPKNGLTPAIAIVALVLGACAMGISPVFVRFADVGAFASAFWRVALALPILLVWAIAESPKGGTKDALTKLDTPLLLCGIFFAGDLFFWHLAILNTTIANATLLACLAPVWVAMLSGIVVGEKVTRTMFVGLALCIAGAAMLIGDSLSFDKSRLYGDICGLITSFFFGIYFLAVKVSRKKHKPGALTLKSTTVTAVILLVVTVVANQSLIPQSGTGIIALLALGLVSHAGGQGMLTIALGRLSAMFSSLVIFMEAIAAATVAWIIFGEILSVIQVAGGALILAGIWTARPK